ncbi:CYTH and CHAD domain-containing protein [Herbiconiux sp. KACC 21604]|uniref:CYTH and CHAD domain-containing protein n=1 Tax=unclassified Herbiconiux TaxID=2618217 RepID=UPI001490E5D1|nr:CYTH and CHAD domain-containing protein [Herbiconiux sp. SALV-R1]QJU53876.1 CYTH and CHAD domain-containing protein [Herbiconiux sp. SALV-R1]WPO84889.1 CYTH and CHAD domain-containing protein [Herbiconiux sp. KACC 21604]
MAHTVQTEIEQKFSIGDDRPVPELTGIGAVESVEHLDPVVLEAVYYDTDSLALARRRIALRRRQGGHDEGWHVKLPAAEGRTELQWPLAVEPPAVQQAAPSERADADTDHPEPAQTGVATEVPQEVLDAVRVHVRDHRLTPLARISTTRAVTNLLDADGRVVIELADDRVVASDARAGVARAWREWEVELGEAAPGTPKKRAALLEEAAALLLAAGAEVSPSVSKLAQALGRTGLGGTEEQPGNAAPAAPARTVESALTPAAAVVLAGVRDLATQIVDLDPRVRADDDDAVHRLRVVVRRLRSVLASHRALFDDAHLDRLRDALSRLGALLGETRDLEVRARWAADALAEVEADRGVVDADARRRLVDDTRAEHADAHRRLVAAMSDTPYYRLLDELDALLDGPVPPLLSDDPSSPSSPKKFSRKVAGKEASRALKRTVTPKHARRVDDVDPVEAARALAALHASRKAARRLRYTVEFADTAPASTLGGRGERIADAAEELQDALGWHRDASLFADFVLLTAQRADAAGESSFTYGVLHQRASDQAARALALADDARRELRRTV